MQIDDPLWKDVWSKEKYEPISGTYKSRGFGTDREPESSVCMASFANAMGDKFKEGMVLLDYGCGSGRFCNFMSKRLKDFSYYGVERLGSSIKWGENAISFAREYFGGDPRVSLGFIGDKIEREAIDKADVVLLLSIFTHVPLEETNEIMDKLMPIINKGGSVIFSMFIENNYQCVSLNPVIRSYGFENFYFKVNYTERQIKDIAKRLNIKIDKNGTFINHIIFNAHR